MDGTFGDAIAYYSDSRDNESKLFVEYILLKYFDGRSFFMRMQEAIPFLEENDKETLCAIVSRIRA